MNRIIKPADSQALQQELRYTSGSKNTRLREIIRTEQRNYCAYTQALLSSTHLAELDHFNPTLKDTEFDDYNNWFVINSRWNRIKGDSRRWNRYQTNLRPTDANFEERILYENGYFKANPEDDDAQNFIDYLYLNQSELVKDRIELISRLKDMYNDFGKSPNEFKTYLQQKFPHEIQFLRALEEELDIVF